MAPLNRTRILLLFFLTLPGCTRPPVQEPVLLGYVDTLGVSGRQGAQLAIKEANETDGLVAGRRVALLAPNLGGPESLPAVATRLVSVNRVPALLGGGTTAEIEALGRAAQPAGAFVVAAAALPGARLGDNVFPAQLAPLDQGTLLARHVAAELKADTVVLLSGPAAHHAELATAFTRQLAKETGPPRVVPHTFHEKTVWAELAREVQAASPKAVVIAGSGTDFARLRAALNAAGINVPLLFGGTMAERLELEADAEASRGVWLATVYPAVDDASYRAFAANYQAAYGAAPDAAAHLTYDASKVLIGALRRARLASPDRLREELARAYVVKFDEGKYTEARSYRLPGKESAPTTTDVGNTSSGRLNRWIQVPGQSSEESVSNLPSQSRARQAHVPQCLLQARPRYIREQPTPAA